MKTVHLSPAEYRRRAAGMTLSYGFCGTPFGEALLGWCEEGVCYMGFVTAGPGEALQDMAHRWPGAQFEEDEEGVVDVAAALMGQAERVTLVLKGTPFQIAVWEELLRIPFGTTSTYGAVAAAVGRPRAVRAVGTAVGDNNISLVVPCHRVLRSDGSPGGYHWGPEHKRAILDWERANAE